MFAMCDEVRMKACACRFAFFICCSNYWFVLLLLCCGVCCGWCDALFDLCVVVMCVV